jgi:membrane protein YqaA with SNARE-associated domain
MAYIGLFVAAFGAATILPLQSESVLVGLLLAGEQSVSLLVLVASVGNTAGSTVNWILGRYIERYRQHRWFPVSEAALTRAQHWYQRWGKWSLLLSWLPLVGDPLTIVAGVLRERLSVVVLLVAIAKTARYLVLTAAVLGWQP